MKNALAYARSGFSIPMMIWGYRWFKSGPRHQTIKDAPQPKTLFNFKIMIRTMVSRAAVV